MGHISTRKCSARFLLVRNSKHKNLCAHFITSSAESSLLPPRHRC